MQTLIVCRIWLSLMHKFLLYWYVVTHCVSKNMFSVVLIHSISHRNSKHKYKKLLKNEHITQFLSRIWYNSFEIRDMLTNCLGQQPWIENMHSPMQPKNQRTWKSQEVSLSINHWLSLLNLKNIWTHICCQSLKTDSINVKEITIEFEFHISPNRNSQELAYKY